MNNCKGRLRNDILYVSQTKPLYIATHCMLDCYKAQQKCELTKLNPHSQILSNCSALSARLLTLLPSTVNIPTTCTNIVKPFISTMLRIYTCQMMQTEVDRCFL